MSLEIENIYALRSAGLLADMPKPGDGHQDVGFVCLGDGVAHHFVFTVANASGGDDDVRRETLVFCREAVQQLDGVITNSDAPHLRSVFAEHGGEHGPLASKICP